MDSSPSRIEAHVSSASDTFNEWLHEAKQDDVVICRAQEDFVRKGMVAGGRLKCVRKKLHVEDAVLKTSGRPVIPSSMRVLAQSENLDFRGFRRVSKVST